MGMLEVLRTRVLAEPWLLLLMLALGGYFVLIHRPRAAGKQKAVVEKEAAKQKADDTRCWQEWHTGKRLRWQTAAHAGPWQEKELCAQPVAMDALAASTFALLDKHASLRLVTDAVHEDDALCRCTIRPH